MNMGSEQGYLHTTEMAVGYRNHILIRDIALSVRKGEIVTLIGPNGAGKSTILRSIIRRIPLICGEMVLDGEDLREMPGTEQARRMSVLLTDRIETELMSAREIAATGRYPYTGRLGILSAADWAKVDEALEAVGASGLGDQDFSTLSDGQRQRILLARALCQEPELLVMDEPTAYLDIYHKLEFLSLLQKLAREKALAVLLSLHEMELAQRVSDRIVCVKGDRIFAEGTPEEIFRPEVICSLYGLSPERYVAGYGTMELAKCPADPASGKKTFVICGGGTGIPVFRRLQRQGRSFYAGILQENDIDYPAAAALAEGVVSVPAFAFPDAESLEEAQRIMADCDEVICTVKQFARGNQQNRVLMVRAREEGKLAK